MAFQRSDSAISRVEGEDKGTHIFFEKRQTAANDSAPKSMKQENPGVQIQTAALCDPGPMVSTPGASQIPTLIHSPHFSLTSIKCISLLIDLLVPSASHSLN